MLQLLCKQVLAIKVALRFPASYLKCNTSGTHEVAGMKASLVSWSVIVGLTLTIWLFFYVFSEPLDVPGTTVVAGFSVAVVYVGKRVGRFLTKRGTPR